MLLGYVGQVPTYNNYTHSFTCGTLLKQCLFNSVLFCGISLLDLTGARLYNYTEFVTH